MLHKNRPALDSLLAMPIVGIVRHLALDDFKNLLPVYQEAGLKYIEVTMNTPGAEIMIDYAVKNFGTQLVVGAGTVCDTATLQLALDAGAAFVVTPIVEEAIIHACVELQVPVMPGAFTPTEIYKAWNCGSAIVKVFPAASFGPSYIKEVKAPLNHIPLMPTGGVNLHNLLDFFKAGASAAGMGSQLFDKQLIKARNWPALGNHFASFAAKLNSYRS